MVSVFEHDNYRKFLIKRLSQLPRKGYGKMSQLARFLGVHSTLVSQILKGHKELTTDQAAAACDFLGLGDLESEYFVLLVQLDRAGNSASKNLFKRQLSRVSEQSQTISRRIKSDVKLTEEQRAVFYSDWAYSAARQSVAIPGIKDIESIAEYLGLPRKKVQRLMEFLTEAGLCKVGPHEISVGPASTFLEASSPWARVHHTNWRNRAIHALDQGLPSNLHYSCPLTLSIRDSALVKERLIQLIEEVNSIVDPSPSEALFCLNIDWFKESALKNTFQ